MRLKNWFLGLMFVAVGLVSGCGSSSNNNYSTNYYRTVSAEQFRLLLVGDSWTYSETSMFTPPGGGAAPVAFYYTHLVTVVKKTNPKDSKEYLALQHDFTPRTGTPAMGTEWDLFTQDASTREIKVVGNITPTGTFIQKSNTLFAGAYFLGLTHKQDWDISDNLITFNSKVIGNAKVSTELPIPGGFRKLDVWVVLSEEQSEPAGQNVFDQGNLISKINPTIGHPIEIDASFSTPFAGGTAEMTLHSDLIATNVNLDTAPSMVTVPYDSSNYTAPPAGSETFRTLQAGDTWTFSETAIYTAPGSSSAPVALGFSHVVTVVSRNNPFDPDPTKLYSAFKHEVKMAGATAIDTSYDVFIQDPVTKDVNIVANIPQTGAPVQIGGTPMFTGTYSYGAKYIMEEDVQGSLVKFSSVVLGKTTVTTEIPIPGGFRKLDTWIVMGEELSETVGQNVFDQGHIFKKVNPKIGYLVEYDSSFSTPTTGGRLEVTLHSDLVSTNVPLP